MNRLTSLDNLTELDRVTNGANELENGLHLSLSVTPLAAPVFPPRASRWPDESARYSSA